MNTSIQRSPSFALQTIDGRTVYTNGRMKYSLTYNKWGTSIPIREKVGESTPEGRAKRLARVQDQIGESLQWVDGPVIEYILV